MNKRKYDIQKVNYHHLVLEGTQYEVGRQLGQLIDSVPGGKEVATSGKLDLQKVGFPSFQALWNFCEECCPGIGEEIQGFADHFGSNSATIPFWNWTFADKLGGNCTQMALLSPTTQNHHNLFGRSYEWNHHEEDLKLITTRINGKPAHIGFSCMLHGRHDGMNEHGLVVSMSGGGIFGVPFKHRGPMFWLVIRALLESCKSVDDVLEEVKDLPMTGYFTLLIADKHANGAIVEIADGHLTHNRIDMEASDPMLYAVNHFRLPEMEQYNKLNCGIIHHSKIRQQLILDWYGRNHSNIRKDDLINLFSTLHPKGLCNHFYNDGFGTLWSMIFDLDKLAIDVCFGAPTHNKYSKFNLEGKRGISEYPAVIPITEWY